MQTLQESNDIWLAPTTPTSIEVGAITDAFGQAQQLEADWAVCGREQSSRLRMRASLGCTTRRKLSLPGPAQRCSNQDGAELHAMSLRLPVCGSKEICSDWRQE